MAAEMRAGPVQAGGTPPAVPPPRHEDAPRGWICPGCDRGYAPWVSCCGTCGPGGGQRRGITEN